MHGGQTLTLGIPMEIRRRSVTTLDFPHRAYQMGIVGPLKTLYPLLERLQVWFLAEPSTQQEVGSTE